MTDNKVVVVEDLLHLTNLKQLFFDCDNTLAHTESLAFEVTDIVVNEMLESQGVEERYTAPKLISYFIGLTFKQMMPKLAEMHNFKLTDELFNHMKKREEEEVIRIVQEQCKACPGSVAVLEKLVADNKYPIAVVSSSSTRRITATLTKTDQLKYFRSDRVYSAASMVAKGKPEPDIYLHVLKELGLKPAECLTVEDSRIGALAAIKAGIPVIGYLGCYNGVELQRQLAFDMLEMGCETVMYTWDEYLGLLESMTKK